MKIKGIGKPRRPKRGGKPITTRSGRVLKVNRSLGQRWSTMREAKTFRKLNRLKGLPKSRLKRLLWRLQPKHLAKYWFSRDGGIMALKITGIAILVLFVLTLGVFAYFRKDLPDIKDISGSSLGGSISYYDRTGKVLLWQDYNAVKRVPVRTEDISKFIMDATVAVEDKDFYNHRGFDVRGITRAAINDIFHRDVRQGGSTITQQLVKLTQDWAQQRTFTRKVKELILAVELERTYTKEEILTGYLNAAPYGGIDYGVQVAASDYFHKSAKDLTLAEAAMLAAIPKSPTLYSPYSGEYFSKDEFLGRYGYVLDQMVNLGMISKKQADEAKKFDILATIHPQQTKYAGIRAPYFVLAARNEIITKRAPQGPGSNKPGGWKVITTLDLKLQELAEKTIQNNRANALRFGADAQALVAEDVKTGQVVALVGGNDFENNEYGKINYAQWNISPGSSFKPYDYVALIENGNAGAGSVLYDVQQPIPGYPCTNKAKPSFGRGPASGGNCLYNYDFRYPGAESLRYALGGSRNVPAVKAMLAVVPGNETASINKTISTANDLMAAPGAYKCYNPGVDVNTATKSDEAQCFGASAIGDGAYLHLDQHTHGVASISRMGLAIPQTYILKIYDSKSENKPLYEWKQPKEGDDDVKQAVRPEAAYIVNNMASDPNASYLSFPRKWHNYNGWRTAVKTGTTNNGFDGLMMGWNSKYAVGSWVGHHTRNKRLTTFMENLTQPLTRDFMRAALDASKAKAENWTEPSGIQRLPAYVMRTHVGNGSVEPSPGTDLYPSWYKPKGASTQSITLDKVSGKLATNCTPSLAQQKLGGSSAPTAFSVDPFYPPGGGSTSTSTTGASDDVHSCSDTKPSITLTVADTNCSSCTFTAFVQAGTHPFNDSQYSQYPGTVNFYVNGQLVGSKPISDPADTVSITYNASSGGSGTVTAQVIDSVLYDATSNAVSVNFSGGGSVKFEDANLVSASWSGGTGPYTVKRDDTNTTICDEPAGSTSCAFGPLPNNTQITITDNSTGKTDSKKVHP
ncbi:transglycosylase domain-containing protein [Candidatus Saccharibacteria bacterium]|nr:transglycosylase domain-containing protein [Candidatus Saccharibacteria bacterium]MBI2285445.1 transglycosylase domain-containing protein [Candidatus Saccharibacteria bacterium]